MKAETIQISLTEKAHFKGLFSILAFANRNSQLFIKISDGVKC